MPLSRDETIWNYAWGLCKLSVVLASFQNELEKFWLLVKYEFVRSHIKQNTKLRLATELTTCLSLHCVTTANVFGWKSWFEYVGIDVTTLCITTPVHADNIGLRARHTYYVPCFYWLVFQVKIVCFCGSICRSTEAWIGLDVTALCSNVLQSQS